MSSPRSAEQTWNDGASNEYHECESCWRIRESRQSPLFVGSKRGFVSQLRQWIDGRRWNERFVSLGDACREDHWRTRWTTVGEVEKMVSAPQKKQQIFLVQNSKSFFGTPQYKAAHPDNVSSTEYEASSIAHTEMFIFCHQWCTFLKGKFHSETSSWPEITNTFWMWDNAFRTTGFSDARTQVIQCGWLFVDCER